MTISTEKRQNVRALFSAQARVKLLDVEQSKKIRDFESRLKKQKAPYAPDTGSMAMDTSALLGPILAQIDEKLDRILNLLEKQAGIEQTAQLTVKDTVDISGSGVCLILSGPAQKGQVVEIELEIPGFPLNRLKLFGKITRYEPYKKGKENLYEVGIEFLNLNDQDREKLIAFSFTQQRKMIRSQKK